jgi:hypothetical protein
MFEMQSFCARIDLGQRRGTPDGSRTAAYRHERVAVGQERDGADLACNALAFMAFEGRQRPPRSDIPNLYRSIGASEGQALVIER